MAVVELHSEHCIREWLDDSTFDLDNVIFFCHKKTGPDMGRTAIVEVSGPGCQIDPNGRPR